MCGFRKYLKCHKMSVLTHRTLQRRQQPLTPHPLHFTACGWTREAVNPSSAGKKVFMCLENCGFPPQKEAEILFRITLRLITFIDAETEQ